MSSKLRPHNVLLADGKLRPHNVLLADGKLCPHNVLLADGKLADLIFQKQLLCRDDDILYLQRAVGE